MVKIIIVDGVDCSGKSTLIERISKDKRFRNSLLIKNNYRPSGEETIPQIKENYIQMRMMLQNLSGFEYVIIDRWYMSEMIYGKLRGYEPFEDDWYKTFEESIQDLKEMKVFESIIYIHMCPSLTTIYERFDSRGDEHINREQIEDLWSRYIKFTTDFSKLPFMVMADNGETEISLLHNFLKHEEE